MTNAGNCDIIQLVQLKQIIQIGESAVPKIFSGKQHIYVEVAQRYKNYIDLGVLKAGDKLPSVRMAAEEMGVNPNTVQKAYTELESEGYIYSLPKKGVFVSDVKESKAHENAKTAMLDELRNTLTVLKDSGINKDTIANIIKEVYPND